MQKYKNRDNLYNSETMISSIRNYESESKVSDKHITFKNWKIPS